jgi:acyl-CoA thioester hydrolase
VHAFAFRVRYAETDAMGWAYYAHYLRWFEIGRAEMLRALGRSYRSVEEDLGVLLPVRDARCRYLEGARYDDALIVETGVASRTRATVRFAYRVRREAEPKPLAIGTTLHFFMGRNGRPMRPPAALEALLAIARLAPPELIAALEAP